MGKNTEKILKAKQAGSKEIVQKLQQGMDKYKKEINKTFKKIEGSLNDSSETEEYPYECESKADDNRILREVAEGSTEVIDDVGQNMPQKTSTAEDTVAYIKENYPETEENLTRYYSKAER